MADPNEKQTNEEGAERKLTVIMFTDIKGFSRKMSENEAAAFDMLKKHDAMLRVLSTKYGGKVIKSIGDSFMIDFASAVNAVKCGIEAQKKFHHHNDGKSEFEKIEIRIGIHLGDVLTRGEDIFGDGVNIASRIESITAPTRICITADVYNQIRKRMDVEVFRMGDMRLKNIQEPVEVFEILIPDIPDFSMPSKKAAEESKKQSLEASEAHANRVSGHESFASVFDQQTLTMTDEEKQVQAEEMYQRAEKYFQMGRIQDAEAELKKVEELVPSYEPSQEVRQEEEAKETKVQVHLSKARALISDGELEEAEEQIRKVFEHYPLHVGAQQILIRIEEERYRKEEEERLQKATEKKKHSRDTVEQKKVSDILEQVQKYRDNESFTEAIYTLRDVFTVDPNNSVARSLEKEIQQEQAEKEARDRRAAEAEERRLEEERLERQRKRSEREQVRKVSMKTKPAEKKKGSRGLLIVGALLILFGVALYLSLPTIMRTFFPVRVTIAALPFTGAAEQGLTHGLPQVILEDLSRVNNVSTRATTSSFKLDPRSFNSDRSANSLNVTHVLTGAYEITDRGTELTVRLIDVKEQTPAFARRMVLLLDRFPAQRRQLVEAIIDELGIDGTPQPVASSNASAEEYAAYLSAHSLIQYEGYEQLQQARSLLENITESGNDFPEAKATLGEAYARLGRIGAATDDAIEYAMNLARQAAQDAPGDPSVVQGLATTLLAGRRFADALAATQDGIRLAPQNAEFHRLQAELSLIAGNYEAATTDISRAVSLDPSNPRTFLLKGWYAHLRGENAEAAKQYEAAIEAGGNRSYILSAWLASAWLRGTNRDGAVRYYTALAETRPADYRVRYGLGRAFSEKLDSAQTAFRDGLRLATEAFQTDQDDLLARVYRALFLTRLGRFSDATAILEQLLDENVSDPLILYRIANAYTLQTKKEKALEILAEALDARFSLSEIINPDFGAMFDDPDFRSLTIRPIQPAE